MAERLTLPKLKRTVMVVAGNMMEFKRMISDLSFHCRGSLIGHDRAVIDSVRYYYVSSPDTLRGLHNVDFEFLGTWHERKDIDQIRSIAAHMLISEGREVPWRE